MDMLQYSFLTCNTLPYWSFLPHFSSPPFLSNLLSLLCYGSRYSLQTPVDYHVFFLHLGIPTFAPSKSLRRL